MYWSEERRSWGKEPSGSVTHHWVQANNRFGILTAKVQFPVQMQHTQVVAYSYSSTDLQLAFLPDIAVLWMQKRHLIFSQCTNIACEQVALDGLGFDSGNRCRAVHWCCKLHYIASMSSPYSFKHRSTAQPLILRNYIEYGHDFSLEKISRGQTVHLA
jgi:hypothetical protein